MRIPRDISGKELIKLLSVFGYEIIHQKGSHIKVTTKQNWQHHIAVPNHDPIKIGTLNGIISQVANHLALTKNEISEKLFGK